jgi:hypothetical protein
VFNDVNPKQQLPNPLTTSFVHFTIHQLNVTERHNAVVSIPGSCSGGVKATKPTILTDVFRGFLQSSMQMPE